MLPSKELALRERLRQAASDAALATCDWNCLSIEGKLGRVRHMYNLLLAAFGFNQKALPSELAILYQQARPRALEVGSL